jgi:hypothetical protein
MYVGFRAIPFAVSTEFSLFIYLTHWNAVITPDSGYYRLPSNPGQSFFILSPSHSSLISGAEMAFMNKFSVFATCCGPECQIPVQRGTSWTQTRRFSFFRGLNTVVTICTTCFNIKTLCLITVRVKYDYQDVKKAFTSINSINQFIFVMDRRCIFF